MDDLFMIGAAVEIFRGGDLRNPWLVGQLFPSSYYFSQLPLHSWLLAAWLRLCGLGVWPMLSFISLCLVATACALRALFRTVAVRIPLTFAFLITAVPMMQNGLRPEVLGLVWVILGAAMRGRSTFSRYIAASCFGLALLSAARMLPLVVTLVPFTVYRDLDEPGANPTRWWLSRLVRNYGIPWLLAAASLVVLLLCLVGFHILEFWRVFCLTANARIAPFHLRNFGNAPAWLSLAITVVTTLVLGGKPGNARQKALILALVAAALLMFCSGTGLWQLFFFTWLVAAGLLVARTVDGQKWRHLIIGTAALIVMVPLDYSAPLVDVLAGAARKAERPPREAFAMLRARIYAQNANRIRIDSGAARYVFAYDLPAGTLDFSFSEPFPGQAPDDRKAQADGEIWCVSRYPFRHGRSDIVPPLDGPRLLPREAFRYDHILDAIYLYGGDFGNRGMVLTARGLVPLR
jgi:hypothetical protein